MAVQKSKVSKRVSSSRRTKKIKLLFSSHFESKLIQCFHCKTYFLKNKFCLNCLSYLNKI